MSESGGGIITWADREIERVYPEYSGLHDDEMVRAFLTGGSIK